MLRAGYHLLAMVFRATRLVRAQPPQADTPPQASPIRGAPVNSGTRCTPGIPYSTILALVRIGGAIYAGFKIPSAQIARIDCKAPFRHTRPGKDLPKCYLAL